MPNVGPGELMVILAIALVVFGPKKLPEFGKSVGKALREFNRAKTDFMSTINVDDDDYDSPRRATPSDTVSASSEPYALDYPHTSEVHAPMSDLDSADAMPYGSDFHAADDRNNDTQMALHGAPSESGERIAASATSEESLAMKG